MNAQNQFNDYYLILQVHQNAEPEIIKSAYRRLAQMHHPDHNSDPKSIFKMQQINQAYNIISNPELRRAYHAQWVRHHQKFEPQAKAAENKDSAAHQVLDAYFHNLLHENWVLAYQKLTVADQKNVPMKDFKDWKEAVKILYQMGSYVIKPFRTYERCMVGDKEYEKVHVFSVFMTDKDNRTGNISEETYTKYVVQEKGRLSVCLGYTDLKPIVYKLKYLATQAPELDPTRVYRDTLLKYDKLTGLLSRRGLAESMELEIARKRRFKCNFSLAVLTIDPMGTIPGIAPTDYLHMCISNTSAQLKNTLRSIDQAARFTENQLAVLLIQTEYLNAHKALNRLVKAVKQGEGLKYSVTGSVTAYQGESVEDTLIRAANDAKMQEFYAAGNTKKYRIRFDGEQI